MRTETLTDDMIRTLRTEAIAASDFEMETICDDALEFSAETCLASRQDVARALSDARAMDDSKTFVRVVA